MNDKTKRILLIGVAVFCLLIFSVNVSIYGFFDSIGRPDRVASITLPNGSLAKITYEDADYARRLAMLEGVSRGGAGGPAPFSLIPATVAGTSNSDRVTCYQILRRVAVEAGIDVADEDVIRAREVGRELFLASNSQVKPEDFDYLQYARLLQLSTVEDLDNVLREAIRISTYIQLELFGSLDTGDAVLADSIREERKVSDLSHVRFESKPRIEALEKDPPKDEELQDWIAKLEDPAVKNQFVDDMHVSFGMIFGRPSEIDPSVYKDYTKDLLVSDAQVEEYYDRNKEDFRKPESSGGGADGEKKGGDGGEGPGDGKKPGDGKEQEKKGGEDENGGLTQDGDQGSTETPGDAGQEPGAGEPTEGDATAEAEQDDAYYPFETMKPGIRKLLEAKNVIEGIRRKALEAFTDYQAKKAAQDAAKEGEDGEKKEVEGPVLPLPERFSLEDWFAKEFEGKPTPGLRYVVLKPAGRPESFRERDDLYGTWNETFALRTAPEVDHLSAETHMTKRAIFMFQILERKLDVVRPLDEVREAAQKEWAKQKAEDEIKEAAEAFRKLVRTKAESLEPDEVGKKREASKAEVAKKFEAWKKEIQGRIDGANGKIGDGGLPKRSIARLKKNIETWTADLAKAEDRRKVIQEEADGKLDEEIAELVSDKMGEGFALAAKEKGLAIQKLEGWILDENQGPRFRAMKDGPEKFLKELGDVQSLDEGKVSEVLEDPVGQQRFVVRMDRKVKGGMEVVTRKALEARRAGFQEGRYDSVLQNAYSAKALIARFGYKSGDRPADNSGKEAGSGSGSKTGDGSGNKSGN